MDKDKNEDYDGSKHVECEKPVEQLSKSVKELKIKDKMDQPGLPGSGFKLEQLKKDVLFVLGKYPEGVRKSDLWALVQKHTGRLVSAKQYGLSKMSKALDQWTDVIELYGRTNKEKVRLKFPSLPAVNPSVPAASGSSTAMALLSEMQKGRKTSVEEPADLNHSSSGASAKPERHVEQVYEKLLTHLSSIKSWIHDYMTANRNKAVPEGKLRSYLRTKLRGNFRPSSVSDADLKKLLKEECKDIVVLDENSLVHVKEPQRESVGNDGHVVIDDEYDDDDDADGQDELTNEEDSHYNREKLAQHASTIRARITEILLKHGKSIKSTKLRRMLSGKINKQLGLSNIFNRYSAHWFFTELCRDIVHVDRTGNVHLVDSGRQEQKTEGSENRPTAMSLMSSLSSWGKPAVTGSPQTGEIPVVGSLRPMANTNVNQNAQKAVPSFNFISLVDEDKHGKKTEVIDLTEDRESPVPVETARNSLNSGQPAVPPNNGNQPAVQNQIPVRIGPARSLFTQFQLNLPGAGHLQMSQPQSLLGIPTVGQFQVPTSALQAPHTSHPQLTQSSNLSKNIMSVQEVHPQTQSTHSDVKIVPMNNPFATGNRDPSLPGFRDEVIDLTTKSVDGREFEKKLIDVRPVYVPHGSRPPREQVDTVAKECIEMLADANEFVTQERVEKLVCQRFGCNTVRQLGFNYVDQIPCVNELNRMVCKINAYVIAFVKTRSICTLHELKEALQDYAPDQGDFSLLKVGPLQRFPVVYQQFKFPPDQAEIPKITSMDILDHFHNYLTKKRLWTSRLELEPFMDYMVQEYNADNAYMLGIRIRSLPLAAAVLKKAQRDTGSKHREITEHFRELLKNEIENSFRKFRASILQTGEGEDMEVRRHYLKMRPEVAISEVLDKFNVLIMATQANAPWKLGKSGRFKKTIEEFVHAVKQDDVGKTILHLAICMSNLAVEETAVKLLTPADEDSDEENDTQKAPACKPPPRKDELVHALKTYIERCLNAGALSLSHLDRIEEKLLEDFEFTSFNLMGYGRFLEFLLSEMKKVLEESCGLTLGSGSGGGEGEMSFKPHQTDIMEFIKQCRLCGLTEPEQIEDALCKQYGVKEVRHLGYGNISRLLSHADKQSRHMYADFTVFYGSTLVPSTGLPSSSGTKVGILGHQTRDAAKICLHNCPLLENLAEWSQWSLVFEPELGKLKDFVEKYGGVSNKTLEGGRVATLDFLALELKPGELVKIVSDTSAEHVACALERRDVMSTAGHLVSMVVSYKGVNSMPLALLSGHVKTALLQMHAGEPAANEGFVSQHTAAVFVLQCLLSIPTQICVALANQIFLEPLGQVMGSSKSKQVLVQLCQSLPVQKLNQLVELGCLLGIQEWTEVIQQKCQLPDSAVQILSLEAEEIFKEDNPEQEEESEEEESDSEEIDDILTGDVTMKVKDSSEADASKSEIMEEKKVEPAEEDKEVEADKDVSMADAGTEDLEDKEPTAAPTCEDIINEIRRDEFGVGLQLSEDGQRLMKVQQERLGRSLDRLSKDLYSKDTHFVLELIQNADDNSYHDNLLNSNTEECPSVKFVIKDDGIYVLNNELGFREKDIRALCDVGRSTKGKHKFGYIGQKGIGFKSVFRVTDSPEVHSNGFHIKFDVKSGPMGYILPHWVPEEDRIPQDDWMTHIILRLKTDLRLQTRTLAARFNDIHPSLLLFLHRLRQITIENKIEDSVQMMRRRDIGDNVVEIQHTHGCERWLVIKKMLDASKISVQAKSGADVESTEIALAFPLRPQGQKSNQQVLPPKQPVFAFLPLRSYGFRFIVQGDFDVPSSREDVDRDSSWNQWLRNEIPAVFLDAIDVFKTHEEFNSIEAVCAFLQFVPMEDEVLDFFKPVSSDILKKLKAKPCVPTQPNAQGQISWKMPSQTVRVRDPLVRSVITPDLLQTHLNLFYLHTDVAAMLNPTLTSGLGIETLTSDHLFQLGKALIVNMGTHCKTGEEVTLIAKWLACMYRSLDEFHHDDTILTTLKSQKILPLSDGELVSIQDKTVFYPLPNSGANRQRGRDPLYFLQQDVNSLHPMLLSTDDSEVNSQVHKLLLRLGIKQLSPFDIINHHIIPVLKSDKWQSKSEGTLVSYLVYIKEQTDKQASVCNLEEVKDIAVVRTNQGFKNPSMEPVHFPPHYGNPIDLQQFLSGYDWTLLDHCYLPHPLTQPVILSWHDFFQKLGVEDFLSVRKKDVHLKKEDLAKSVWSTASALWPPEEQEYIVQDYSSAELEGLLLHNKYGDGDLFAAQMRNLCVYLDRHWDTRFSRYCITHIADKDGKILKETDTSFSILLKTTAWLPAVQTEVKVSPEGMVRREVSHVIKEPSCLYLKSEVVHSLLSDNVLYLNVNLSGGTFYQFLGLKNLVTIETVKEYLLQWCDRKNDDVPAVFCTSLNHMKNVYLYLGSQLKKQDLQDLLREKPVYFVPDRGEGHILDGGEIVPAKMLNRKEVWLFDKTGLFDKHRLILEEFHSETSRKRTICGYYNNVPEIIELFRQEGRLDVQPKVEEYIELLGLLCSTTTPKDTKILGDVLYIFSVIGQILVTPQEGLPDEQTRKMAMDSVKSVVQKQLQKQKVFPTNKQIWVSAEDRPMIADNREWEQMFADKEGVHFLDLEDKTTKVPRKGRYGSTPRGQRTKGYSIESRIQPDMIDVVVEVCGIKKLSQVVEIRPTPELIEPCLKLQAYFHQIVPPMQQYLCVRFEDVYRELETMNTKAMLVDAKFYQAGKLEVSYWLTNVKKDTFHIRPEKCVISPPEFYFHKEHLETLSEINREVARYFSRSSNDCSTSLRSFLSELTSIVLGTTDDTVEGLLLRHDADNCDIPAEEMWAVEAPVMPEPDLPEPEPEPEPETFFANDESQMDQTGQRAGSPVMRAWPPVASGNVVKVREKSEKPASNIWPPPQAKDYMKSVKDLPANIRVVGPGGPEKPADGTTTEKGDHSESVDKTRVIHLGQHTEGTVMPGGAVSGQPGVSGTGGLAVHTGTGQQSGHGTGRFGQGDGQFIGQGPPAGQQEVADDQDFGRKRKLSGPEEEQANKRLTWTEGNTAPGADGYQATQGEGQPTPRGDGHQATQGEGQPVVVGEGHPRPEGHYGPGMEDHVRRGGHHGLGGEGDRQGFVRGDGHYRHHGSGRDITRRPPVIKDSPIWSYMATDYSFDDLGVGGDLGVTATLTLEEGAADPEIGRWGEALVAEYLQRQKDLGNILDFSWKNQQDETGCPFDFQVEFADENGIHHDYIEVKSTTSNDKEVFEISVQQIKFASDKSENFHIYRVFNAGNSDRVRLIRITNLDFRLQTKQVKLCMLI